MDLIDSIHREYFYVSYMGAGGFAGASVIPQHVIPGVEENPDGMNLGAAHQYLMNAFGHVCIIIHWQRITKKRSDEFNLFAESLSKPKNSKNVPHLSLVKNEDKEP